MVFQKPLPESKVARLLEKIYYDATHPASFGGVNRLRKASGFSKSVVKKWLASQDTYTLHKPVKYKFQRRAIIAYGIGDLLQADLVDMSKWAKYNNGMKFLLTAMDVLSRKAYVFPIKNKSAKTVSDAFKQLLKQTGPVVNVQTDRGTEFYNKTLQTLFRKLKINHYSTQSEMKCANLERYHRELKNRLYRIFTHRNSYKYIDVLKDVVNSLNNNINSSTGLAPSSVTHENESEIFEKLYGYQPIAKFNFDIGDQVRISKTNKVFRRGYLINWTDEVFTVYKRYSTDPPSYILKDLKDTVLRGRFYEAELQKIIKKSSDYWRIEKILKKRGIGLKTEYFVKWIGFDDRFNSWVKSTWMK